jgi:hypothetical protein
MRRTPSRLGSLQRWSYRGQLLFGGADVKGANPLAGARIKFEV